MKSSKKDSVKSLKNVEWIPLSVGTIILIVMGALLAIFPEEGVALSNEMFSFLTNQLGSLYLWLGMVTFGLTLFFTFSKYGKIYLGDKKPTFSKVSILCMTVAAGFGSATMYWLFMEVISYYIGPPPGILPLSAEAAEIALTASFWHWGFVPWSCYLVCAVLVMYAFYIKGKRSFKFSDILNDTFDGKINVGIRKIIDTIFVVVTMGALSVTLGLSVPMLSRIISFLTGIEVSFVLDMSIIGAIALVFIISSFVGLEKGMQMISKANIYGMLVFLAVVFLASDLAFMANYFTNGVGLFITEFFSFAFNTDPVSGGGFPQGWTIFFLAYWFSFGPTTGVFIAKIAKGHRMGDVLLLTLFGGSVGGMIMFGITSSYTLNLELEGILPLADMLATQDANTVIIETLKTLPIAPVMMTLFTVVCILFMATSLDGAAFSLAGVTSKQLDENGNPSTALKMYWCVALVIFPIILTIANADLNAIKNVAYVVSVPMVAVVLTSIYGAIKGLRKTFGSKTIAEIEEYNNMLGN